MRFQPHSKQSQELVNIVWGKKPLFAVRRKYTVWAKCLMLKQIVRCAIQDGYGMQYSPFTCNRRCQSVNPFHSCGATHLTHKIRHGEF
jgi:hypothetical protein